MEMVVNSIELQKRNATDKELPIQFLQFIYYYNEGLRACTIASFASIINSRIYKRWEDVIFNIQLMIYSFNMLSSHKLAI